MAEHEKRQLIVFKNIGFTGACAAIVPANEIHFNQVRIFRQPDRGLSFATRQSAYLTEPRLDRGMTFDGNRDINVLGNNKAGPGVGFEQVRDFGARYQDTRLLENRPDCVKRF